MKQNLEEKIRRRAYELWEQISRPDGYDRENWLQAEAEINGAKRLESRSAATAPAIGKTDRSKRRPGRMKIRS